MKTRRLFILLIAAANLASAGNKVGPPKGSVLAAGGGKLGPEVLNRFIDLAGGTDASIVFIPTALDPQPTNLAEANILRKAGVKNLTILHTTDRKVADSKTFVEPLRSARGVWLGGGRQWRLVDAYLNTRTLRE